MLTGATVELHRLIEISFVPESPELAQFTPGGFTNTDRIMLVDPRGELFASFKGSTAAVAPAIVAEIEKRRKVLALTRSN